MKIVQGIGIITTAIVLKIALAQDSNPCVEGGFSLEFDGECSYEKLLSAFEGLFDPANCPHTIAEEIRLHLNIDVNAKDSDAHGEVRSICKTAWESAVKLPFKYAHMKGDQFEQMYYNGGTLWNEEVETNLETGTATNRLKEDAKRVSAFYENLAQTTGVEWPGDLPNFDLNQCKINTAMCCWPQDRQAGDNNGNCNTPYDTNCYDKDPADNTDLCFVDLSRSPLANRLDSTGHIVFPKDDQNGEGPIHCHGFAWANDDSDFTSRFKANNLFYVSMYDHMHQRGYVRNIPGAPMCACVEQMPTVTRSDCTQIDVDESYKFVYNPTTKQFKAEITDIEIVFNSCQGRYNRNNDLHAYVARLVEEGKLSNDQRAALDKYIVGDENCPQVSNYAMMQKGYAPGYSVDESTWFKVAGSGSLSGNGIGREGFRDMFSESQHQIVWRVCIDCAPSHQHIYYRRYTSIPDDMDLIGMLLNSWTNTDNQATNDFEIYSTFEDAVEGKNPWEIYSFKKDRGFPYESGPLVKTRNQYRTFSRRYGQSDVAFYVMKKEGGIVPYIDGILNGVDIGSPNLLGDELEKDGKYYMTSGGYDISSNNDQFHFLQEPTKNGDVTIKAYVSSLQNKDSWTKAGLMIRQSMSQNSAHFSCLLTGKYGIMAYWRLETGSSTSSSRHTRNSKPSPTWLMIQRRGDTFTCSKSDDGNEWVTVQEYDVVMETDTIYAGMALSSHNYYELSEAVFEQYEHEYFYYPSAAPTVSMAPNYNDIIESEVTITNDRTGQKVYALKGQKWRKGVGALSTTTPDDRYKWNFLPQACDDIDHPCYYIKNEISGRCLYAQENKVGNDGVGAGPCEYLGNMWHLGNAQCESQNSKCYFLVNALSNRRLYPKKNSLYADLGEYSDEQKWIIELTE